MVGPTYKIVIFSWLKFGLIAGAESFKSYGVIFQFKRLVAQP